MSIVVFSNPGVLDMRAVTVMGVNAKPNSDNPIGFFGTGLKYALAILMRYNASIIIHDGLMNEYVLQKDRADFRDKEFEFISMYKNGERTQLPFTTELGKTWDLWMVLRELECNARDESGSSGVFAALPRAEEGVVKIVVDCPAFLHTYQNEYNTTFFVAPHGEDRETYNGIDVILDRPSQYVYYQGIRAYTLNTMSAHTYNITRKLGLTEDRQINYPWVIYDMIHDLICGNGSTKFRDVLIDNIEAFEWTNYNQNVPEQYSAEALEQFSEAMNARIKLHDKVITALVRRDAKKALEREYNTTDDEARMLEKAVDAAALSGFPVEEYPIRVVETIPGNVLGLARRNNDGAEEIIISRMNFEHGLECTVATLIEEYIHHRFGHADTTREMQDFLMRRIAVTAIRKYNNHKERINDRYSD